MNVQDESGGRSQGGSVWQAVIIRQEFTVEIVAMNNATVLPLEKWFLQIQWLKQSVTGATRGICLHLHSRLIGAWSYKLSTNQNKDHKQPVANSKPHEDGVSTPWKGKRSDKTLACFPEDIVECAKTSKRLK